MNYTTKIYDPTAGLNQILAAATKFNPDRFLYALQYKNWDERTMERMSCEISTYRNKLEAEYNRLVEFSKVFNKEFATMNNDCFNSALTMLKKLRSGISETKRIYQKFCPRARKESIYHTIGNKPVSAYDYSYISADTYQLPLFKFEGYPACISGLYNEMEKFFVLLIRCMQLCIQVLDDEKRIKKDNKYCMYLYEQFKEKILKEILDIVMMIPRESEYLLEENNPAIASRNNYENDEAWAPVGFHNYSKTEVKQLVIKQVLDEEAGSDLARTEIMLFGNDVEKVHKYRHIINHFDDLLPDNYKRKNLPAKMIQMFFQFVGIPYKMEEAAVVYFNDIYNSSATRKHNSVSYQAVNGYKKEVLADADGSYKEFSKNIKMRYFATIPLQRASNF